MSCKGVNNWVVFLGKSFEWFLLLKFVNFVRFEVEYILFGIVVVWINIFFLDCVKLSLLIVYNCVGIIDMVF